MLAHNGQLLRKYVNHFDQVTGRIHRDRLVLTIFTPQYWLDSFHAGSLKRLQRFYGAGSRELDAGYEEQQFTLNLSGWTFEPQ